MDRRLQVVAVDGERVAVVVGVLAQVAHGIGVGVGLVGVGETGAVVAGVPDPVVVRVGLGGVGRQGTVVVEVEDGVGIGVGRDDGAGVRVRDLARPGGRG